MKAKETNYSWEEVEKAINIAVLNKEYLTENE